MANRKKVYFDFVFTNVTTLGKSLRLRATSGAVASGNGIAGRHGDFIAPMAALTGSSNQQLRAIQECHIQVLQTGWNLGNPTNATPILQAGFYNGIGSAAVSYLTVGGGAVANRGGHSSVFSRNFSVLLQAFATGTETSVVATIRGVVIVQREHTMDI